VTPVQFVVDASDANAATLIRNYCLAVLADFNAARGQATPSALDVRPTFLFNPDLKSATFFAPGIVAMILVMISAMLTSITIAREKETGTMEQILVSPVRPIEIVAGKVLPYVGLAFLDGALILGLGMLIFGVPFRGSVALLVGLTGLYILAALSLGLLISTRSRTQQVALMAAQTATLLPTIMLSGLVFPIASMPRILQALTYIVPARYYLLMIRGIMLKGSTFGHLMVPSLALGALTIVWLAVSIRRFRMTLEY
jgi:ABC-2 type transport system permease protein